MEIEELVPKIEALKQSAQVGLDAIKKQQTELGERLQDLEQRAAFGHEHGGGSRGLAVNGLDTKMITDAETFSKFREKAIDKTERYNLGASIKALVNVSNEFDTNTTVFHSQADRSGDIHYVGGLRQLRLLDLLPAIPVSSNRYEFAQLSATGDADAQAQEGDEKAEIYFDGNLVVAPIATIAVHTTASMQVLDDATGLDAFLGRIMTHKVQDKLEASLITGSGTGGNIDGLYTQAPAIIVLANNPANLIGEAQYKMENAGYAPNVVLMNPKDWFDINITENLQQDYVYGSPAVPRPSSLWGMPVITSPSIPVGHALIGDTSQATFLDRMQPTVYMTRDHKDYATRNLVLILVELRAGLALYDVAAFRKINFGAVSQ